MSNRDKILLLGGLGMFVIGGVVIVSVSNGKVNPKATKTIIKILVNICEIYLEECAPINVAAPVMDADFVEVV